MFSANQAVIRLRSMTTRELIGLVLIVAALVLIPVAWLFSRLYWFVGFALFIGGAALFFTDRVIRRIEKSSAGGGHSGDSSGRAMPTDIHNYTGWRSGGRSETMDHSPGGGEGGDA